jgi:protein-tyrosine phosphatase
MGERHLRWDGCFNVRDLGGLPRVGGGRTRYGAIVRGDAPDALTSDGWDALRVHGVRTIVDLRNAAELPDAPTPPPGITRRHVPLDDDADTDFWEFCWKNELDGSPLFYRPFLERKPERVAAVMHVIAEADDGGVLIHCVGGRDRTGLIVLLLLALADVPVDAITKDYDASTTRLTAMYRAIGQPDQGPEIAGILDRKGTSSRALIEELLTSIDVHRYLRNAGLSERELADLRHRLVG